jgi:2-polyprenyl-3-methyl-5-hydroxy-6-metoxy-1,4-benzoquinol methylase
MQTENDIPQAAKTAAYYDDMWEEDIRTIAQLASPGGSGEARVHFIQESLQNIKDQTNRPLQILDLGCGSGWIETFLHPYGHITAVDFSPRAIESARKRYGQYADFLLGDPTQEKLGLPQDQLFDVVVSTEVIEHVDNQVAFVQQIASFLKPGGWCVLTTPNGAIWEAYRQDERHLQWVQPIENWLTAKECATLFQHAGFRITKHHGWSSISHPYKPIFVPLTRGRVKQLIKTLHLMGIWKRLMRSNGFLQFVLAQKL